MPRPLHLLGRAQPGWRGGAVTFSPASYASLILALRGKREPLPFRRAGNNGDGLRALTVTDVDRAIGADPQLRLEFLEHGDLPVSGSRPSDRTDFIRRRVVVNFMLQRARISSRGLRERGWRGSFQTLGSVPDDVAERFRGLLADSCVIHDRHGIRQRIERPDDQPVAERLDLPADEIKAPSHRRQGTQDPTSRRPSETGTACPS